MAAGSKHESIHALFLPYMAPGHMMPLVDIARLFAAHDGIRVTIITTPMNACRFKSPLERQAKTGHPIILEILPFPSTQAGLPEGWENLVDAPTPAMSIKLFEAIELLHPKIEKLIRDLRPDCIVADVLFHWTSDLAIELGVPRLAFSGSGFFNLSVAHCVEHYQPHKAIIESEIEPFVIPSLPDRVVLTKAQLPDIVKTRNKFSELFDKLKEADRKCFGMLVNSFYELESSYADYYRNVIGMKAWHVGPASFFCKDDADKAERGEKASISKHSCLAWLDSKKPNSVLYICFGSLTRFSKAQLIEIASALESSDHLFIWVVGRLLETEKTREGHNDNWWLPEGFEERIKESGKGMTITGWAPQLLILEHQAIGGFMTHCGWNSILEGSTAGVPMVTWPMFAEQFYNEKLVTQVLKFGTPVGNQYWKAWATEEKELVGREKIEKAIKKLMSDDKEAEEMRKVAGELSKLAKKAVEEGGSSVKDLKILIEEIRQYVKK